MIDEALRLFTLWEILRIATILLVPLDLFTPFIKRSDSQTPKES